MGEDSIKCVIFDIDGTLSDPRHRLHYIKGKHPDWESFLASCGHDGPNEYVVTLFKMLVAVGVRIVICTGRPYSYFDRTTEWLRKYGIEPCHYHSLLMRQNKDKRHNVEVKAEMLDRIRKQGMQPLFAVDDRSTVVKMWRQNDVPCFQVDDFIDRSTE